MVVLGCGCGILLPVLCDSVIPWRRGAWQLSGSRRNHLWTQLIMRWKNEKNVRADTLSHRAAFISSEQTRSLFVLAHAIHHKQWRASCELPRCSSQSNNAQVTRLNKGPGPWQERLGGGGGFLSALLNRGCEGGGPVSIQLLSHCVPTSTLQRRGFPSRGKIAEGRHAFFFFSLLHPFLLKKKKWVCK